jgi:hypothetical protein
MFQIHRVLLELVYALIVEGSYLSLNRFCTVCARSLCTAYLPWLMVFFKCVSLIWFSSRIAGTTGHAGGSLCMQVVPTSRAQAHQRAGRAGREAPGKCFRLYPEASFASLPKMTTPEIQRSNLATVVLQLKAIGVSDVLDFQLMSPPPRAALLKALEQLYALECIVCSPPLLLSMALFRATFDKCLLQSFYLLWLHGTDLLQRACVCPYHA